MHYMGIKRPKLWEQTEYINAMLDGNDMLFSDALASITRPFGLSPYIRMAIRGARIMAPTPEAGRVMQEALNELCDMTTRTSAYITWEVDYRKRHNLD